jgi:hypothetical protein
MSDQNSSLNERLIKLEKANRRMKTIGLVLAVALATMGAKTKAFNKAVQAQSFQVVDGSGTVLATLGATNGNGCLSLYDRNGSLRDSICTSSDLVSTGFSTFEGNGTQRTGEGIAPDNSGGFVDFDHTGGARAFIGHVVFENQSLAAVYDPTGAVLTAVDVNPDCEYCGANHTFSGFIDNILDTGTQTYNNRVVLGSWGTSNDVTAADNENLFLFDANGVGRAGLAVDNPLVGPDSELMFFTNAPGNTVGNFYSPDGVGGSYNTFDQDGNFVASLP